LLAWTPRAAQWEAMLDTAYVNPVLPAQDGRRARAFYRDVLGLKILSGPDDDPMMFEAGAGTSLVVTELPERVPPPYPMVSFRVTGIEELVRELEARGVTFEMPAPSSFQGQPGEAAGAVMDYGPVRSAMFKDTEGNVLALNEIADL
jgi:catechol 2,3-dioxygenase-like lactoylglutathione lyase family enzyme